jgi:Cns1/TTC4 Wheel domain
MLKLQYTSLVVSLQKKGYTLGKKRMHQIPESYQVKRANGLIFKVDPFVDNEDFLNFATIVTYLEFGQMDFIQKTRECDTLEAHLQEIFKDRLPWDKNNYYTYDDIVCYVEVKNLESF